jgi:hypothetical protein
VRELLSKLEEAEGRERPSTLKMIEQGLKVHTKIEEDIFYPAFRDAAEKEEDKDLLFEGAPVDRKESRRPLPPSGDRSTAFPSVSSLEPRIRDRAGSSASHARPTPAERYWSGALYD